MALATPRDVTRRLGRDLAEPEHTQVQALLRDAETLILSRIPDLYSRITHGVVSRDVVVLVEVTVVLRVVRNPAGIRSQSADAYSVSYSDSATGELDITPEEWRLLGVRTGLFVVCPTLPPPWSWR